MNDSVAICPIEDCGEPCETRKERRRRRGPSGRLVSYVYVAVRPFCPGHQRRKNGKRKIAFDAPLLKQHASRGAKLSDLDLLLAAGRAYHDVDVTDDGAYRLALRNYVEAARLRTLRPITGLRRPFVVSRLEVEPGVVAVTFKEYKRSTNRRTANG